MAWSTANVFVSSKVVGLPVHQKAVDAFKKAAPEREVFGGLRLENRRGVVTLSTYTEGYVARTIYGRVGVMTSVGGDYRTAYKETDDRVVEERKMLAVQVTFKDNGSVEVVLHPGDIEAAQVLFKGRGFGRKAESVIKDVMVKFKRHKAKYV